METFMTAVVGFFVWTMVIVGLPCLFLRYVFPGNWTREPKVTEPHAGGPVRAGDRLHCTGTGSGHQGAHYHQAAAGDGFSVVDRCEAGIPPPVPEDKRPAACPVCHRNHFGVMCPGPYKAQGMADGSVRYISKTTGEATTVKPAS